MSNAIKLNGSTSICNRTQVWVVILGIVVATAFGAGSTLAAAMPNACPVDGCYVKIVRVERSGEELKLTFNSNFTPDVSKNHFHVWWGEKYTVEQVGRNAQPVFGVKQGRWHRHDDHPTYITQGAASNSVRGEAITICVSSADRNHNVLDVKVFNCVDVSDKL